MILRLFGTNRTFWMMSSDALFDKFFREEDGSADLRPSIYMLFGAHEVEQTCLEHYATVPLDPPKSVAAVDVGPLKPQSVWTDNGSKFPHLRKAHCELVFADEVEVRDFVKAILVGIQRQQLQTFTYDKQQIDAELTRLLATYPKDWDELCSNHPKWKKRSGR